MRLGDTRGRGDSTQVGDGDTGQEGLLFRSGLDQDGDGPFSLLCLLLSGTLQAGFRRKGERDFLRESGPSPGEWSFQLSRPRVTVTGSRVDPTFCLGLVARVGREGIVLISRTVCYHPWPHPSPSGRWEFGTVQICSRDSFTPLLFRGLGLGRLGSSVASPDLET